MPVRDPGRSATAVARRAQIVAATIETIAELGYAQTSFARIAERAELSSTRLISYHFAGKDELIQAVVADVHANMARRLGERLANCADSRGALAAYIRGVTGFIAEHRPQMQALMSIFLERQGSERRGAEGQGTERRGAEGQGAERQSAGPAAGYDAGTEREVLGHLQRILAAGQQAGEFRPFDTFVMAAAVQRSLDGLPFLLRTEPGLDLGHYAEELVTIFDLATRRTR
ncbi:AcrR family transcriptional regulator [Kitasatospora sp. GP30]|uniref:TetR/AcrR family transcriptional regulator n=1 Tax=Kitasatospora sp. GP30 TaxID=3035084 RepID=UPI000C70B3EE|nr:TetR/AcrR family transcriptional regulator [Kitasatospora sp. GP30]MDH6143705.1 AcrR family transcriptional regulator [Kitasatospora sp. GP30]